MSLADELLKLQQLHNSGALTGPEFEDAKHALLHPAVGESVGPSPVTAPEVVRPQADSTLSTAVERYVDLQVREYKSGKIAGIVGAIIALIVLFAVIIPAFSSMSSSNDPTFPGSVPASNFGTDCTANPDGTIVCPP